MIESSETKKLREILKSIEIECQSKLRNADDMKGVHQAQAKLDLLDRNPIEAGTSTSLTQPEVTLEEAEDKVLVPRFVL